MFLSRNNEEVLTSIYKIRKYFWDIELLYFDVYYLHRPDSYKLVVLTIDSR